MNQPFLIKGLVVGLPIGLFISIGIALGLYVNEPGRLKPLENETGTGRAPVSQKDLERVVRLLAEDVGPRSFLDQAESAEAARKFVQSTLGTSNVGYQVSLRSVQGPNRVLPAVIVELPGRGRANEIVTIAAAYTSSPGRSDSGAASGVAALTGVAKAMAETEHQRTIQFVVYPVHLERDLSKIAAKEDTVHSVVLDLQSLVVPKRDNDVMEAGVPLTFRTANGDLGRDVASRFASGTGLQVEVIGDGDVPTWAPQITVTSEAIPNEGDASAWDYPRFTQTVLKIQKLVERLANPGSI